MHAIWNCFAVIGVVATGALVFAAVMFIRQIQRDGWGK